MTKPRSCCPRHPGPFFLGPELSQGFLSERKEYLRWRPAHRRSPHRSTRRFAQVDGWRVISFSSSVEPFLRHCARASGRRSPPQPTPLAFACHPSPAPTTRLPWLGAALARRYRPPHPPIISPPLPCPAPHVARGSRAQPHTPEYPATFP